MIGGQTLSSFQSFLEFYLPDNLILFTLHCSSISMSMPGKELIAGQAQDLQEEYWTLSETIVE